jgi:Tfp pilus assembly protein PilO
MSARDRKLVMILAPLAAFALYWMVLLNPAMDRKASLDEPLATAQTDRDAAVARAAELESAKARYESDYREMVKLVRAIPRSVRVADMMRELSQAADGTGITFNNITMGAANSDAAAGGSDADQVALVDGLDAVPVQLTFTGEFFGLADLFHRVQRFVTMANRDLQIRGRLIKIDDLTLASGSFPDITATIGATVYMAAGGDDPAAKATAVGPPGAERGDGGLKPVDDFTTASVAVPR